MGNPQCKQDSTFICSIFSFSYSCLLIIRHLQHAFNLTKNSEHKHFLPNQQDCSELLGEFFNILIISVQDTPKNKFF